EGRHGDAGLVRDLLQVRRLDAQPEHALRVAFLAAAQGDRDRRPGAVARAARLLAPLPRRQADADALDRRRGLRLRQRGQQEQRGGEEGYAGHGGWWSSLGQGLASTQTQGVVTHLGQPWPYLASTAASRSTSAMLASVASQARTSANSAASSGFSDDRSA